MSWMRGLIERVRETLQRGRFESELDEEIRFHIDREVERLVAGGMSPERARAEARSSREARGGASRPCERPRIRAAPRGHAVRPTPRRERSRSRSPRRS